MSKTAKAFSIVVFILLTALLIVCAPRVPESAFAAEYETLIQKRVGCAVADNLNVVELYGTYSNKGVYAKNLRIVIKDKTGETPIAEIKPKRDAGYLPTILLGNFTGGTTEQIFLGVNGGGSGGFGYYYVFDVTGGKVKTLFDSENCAPDYIAKYSDCYNVTVTNMSDGKIYTINIAGKGRDYLEKLYGNNGKLLKPVSAEVYPVGTVFPYYNSAYGVYQLAAFRQISGLYHADGLGNVISLLRFNGTAFEPYFTNVGVFGYNPKDFI